MIASLLTLSIVVGISVGLLAGYAISRLFQAISKRVGDPTGFVFRLPGGILIFGVKTTEREPAVFLPQKAFFTRIVRLCC
jgi:hypothetical protein